MISDSKLVAKFFTYSPADIAVLEEQAAEQLYLAKRKRFKYARDLKVALRDRPVVERKPVRPAQQKQQQQPLDPQTARAAVCLGVILAPIGMAVFMGLIWIIQQAFK